MKIMGARLFKSIIVFGFLAGFCAHHQLIARQYAAIIVDAKSNEVVHQSNPDLQIHPASMTKMMTLYLVFKAIDQGKIKFTDSLKISKHAAIQPPCKLGLKTGGKLTVKQAVLGAITKSANDASVVLAEALAGSEAKFAEMMTKEAKRLGMKHTIFRNASGLPDKKQISTARDMAKLGQALYRDYPHHFKLFKTQNFVYNGTRHSNHNHLLERVPEIDGIKTGFINASGFNLTASMVKHGRRLIAVVIGGKTARSRDDHMLSLLNTAFDKIAKSGGSQTKDRNEDLDLDQLLATLSQDEMAMEGVVAEQNHMSATDLQNIAQEMEGFETLDQLLAHMDEEQAEAVLAKTTPKKAAAKPLKSQKAKVAKAPKKTQKVAAKKPAKKTAAKKSTKKTASAAKKQSTKTIAQKSTSQNLKPKAKLVKAKAQIAKPKKI